MTIEVTQALLTDKQRTMDALMMDYAAGNLSAAQMLLMDCYADLNDDARRSCRALASVGGVMIETDCAVEPVSAESLDSIFRKIETDKKAQFMPPDCRILPHALTVYTECNHQGVQWKTLAPGIEYYDLKIPCAKREKAQLLKMAPGKSVLEHSHDGLELTLVLDGAFHDDTGSYERGDVSLEEGHSHVHKPVADEQYGCICLAVTTAPLHFTGLLGRVLNPFLNK